MVAQINALEEQLNSVALKQAAAATAGRAAETNTTDSGSVAGFSTPLRDLSEVAPPSQPPMSADPPMRQRQRHRLSGAGLSSGNLDLEDGGGYFDEDEHKAQAKPGDHVKSLLISCASSPVGAAISERLPGLVTWLHQQPPQTLWTAAIAYLALVHLLAGYKTITC
ncbi:unnamed protein product [Ectocarpus sp. 12 AP-2014]